MVKPYKEVIKIMKANGWKYDHTRGSHEIYIKDGKVCPELPTPVGVILKRIYHLELSRASKESRGWISSPLLPHFRRAIYESK